jgi:hypothetical protein
MSGEVKLVRLPLSTKCAGPECGKPLPFGAWAHYHPDTQQAICIECGVKRGWTDKDRANNIIKKLELQEDIKALRERKKIEANALYLLKEQIDLHRLGERDLDLEKQILELQSRANEYLQKIATSEEKTTFKQFKNTIEEAQKLQKEIREQVESRYFLLERKERKQKRKEPLLTEDTTQ